MLRRHPGIEPTKVLAIDNLQSEYRTLWVSDTIVTDGVEYLGKTRAGGRDDVLLLIYPIVGLDFTRKIIEAYKGDVLIVAGTQNHNGYTGFRDMVIDEYMERLSMSASTTENQWRMTVRIPLPSFAGKDEALFVFRRGVSVQNTP